MPTALTHNSINAQRGVAIITVMLMVTLATIASSAMIVQQRLDIQRTSARQAMANAEQLLPAFNGLANFALFADKTLSNEATDTLDDEWAIPVPLVPLGEGLIGGCLVDLQGRFNLNNLVDDSGLQSADHFAQLRRLLDALEIDIQKADAIVDWIDQDLNFTGSGGAESDYYAQQSPPYLAPNAKMAHITELKLIRGFNVVPEDADSTRANIADYEQLLAHVTVLPTPTKINVNTATPAIIQSLASFVDSVLAGELSPQNGGPWQYYPDCPKPEAQDDLAVGSDSDTSEVSYDSVDDFVAAINKNQKDEKAPKFNNTDLVNVQSRFFELRTDVTLGDVEITQFSLLERDDSGRVKVLQRSRGENVLQISPK